MTKKLLLILTTLIVMSCANETNENLYETKSGEYASKTGNFIANFPTEPKYSAIDNQIGPDTIQTHVFISTLGPNKIFSIEYHDYPENTIKSLTEEQIYSQGVSNYSNKMVENFTLEFQKPIEQHGLKGQYFVLNLNQTAKDKGIDGHILGMLFKKENRIYTVCYIGKNDKNTGVFMDSFRLIK